MNSEHQFRLDKRLVRRSFHAAAGGYDRVAVLQQHVGDVLLQRLDVVRLAPQTILDAGAGTGRGAGRLLERYPRARVIALDLALGMLQQARRRGRWLRRPRCVCADVEQLPLKPSSIDLVFSNLTLQWCTDLDATFRDLRRVMRAQGLLMFSTFGPDTLVELRRAWSEVDGFNHVNAFLDLHDVGDALARAGFQGIVMDVERHTLTYRDLRAVMGDLKAMGAHNVTAGRRPTLTGKGRIQALGRAYERYRNEGWLPATFEVLFGHAWAPAAATQPNTARIPVTAVRLTTR